MSPGLEQHLLTTGAVNPEQLRLAAASRKDDRESLIVALERLRDVDSAAVAAAVAHHTGTALACEQDWPDELPLQDRISAHFLNDNAIVPLRIDEDDALVIAVADPDQREALAHLALAVQKTIKLRIAPYGQIAAQLAQLSRKSANDSAAEAEATRAPSAADLERLDDLALEAPVIELVDRILLDAVLNRATDIHIEQRRNNIVLRQRVDGHLRDAGMLPNNLGRAAISRVKILSRLNISERRVPQDGQARVHVNGRDHDIRVVTVPTIDGESAAIRLLSSTAEIPEISRLGLSPRDEAALRLALTAPNGLIVVTGPTGSGKTTTLAACLNHLNAPHRKLVTIEDPVEYQIEGVNQVQVKPDIGITFTSALRTLLRYDPDVMMVGEIRDAETAQIAIHAALTGHLVLTTLHTNSAAGAVTRLLDMGVESYLLASALRCAIGQRLVRRLCRNCRSRGESRLDLSAANLAGSEFKPGQVLNAWKAGSCERCNNTGFFGRLPIFEVFAADSSLRHAISSRSPTSVLHDHALAAGMTSMMCDGLQKCISGDATIEEVSHAVLSA